VAAKTRRSGIGIRRRAQACRERTPTATTTATTGMYRVLRNKPMHTSSTELHGWAVRGCGANRPLRREPPTHGTEMIAPGGETKSAL